ncbi:MAG: T9SS type A sorting domain-containing protein, partial [Raineya sp.]|nr:T9SS type A sorting domain-containing protein [Raineya sp.]
WRDHGNIAATLIPTNAIRSSAAITSFSPFTLASINGFNPLPLELLVFKGKINALGEAELSWQTASELNIIGFEVEKSIDGKVFNKIGFVSAKNTNLNSYNFIDKDFAGLSYYRLRVLEQNKTFRYSQVISLDKTKAVQLIVYPNPATEKDFVKVAIGAREEINKVQVQVFSQVGKMITEFTGNLETSENHLSEVLQALPKGLYILRLQTENSEMISTKFVKQ